MGQIMQFQMPLENRMEELSINFRDYAGIVAALFSEHLMSQRGDFRVNNRSTACHSIVPPVISPRHSLSQPLNQIQVR